MHLAPTDKQPVAQPVEVLLLNPRQVAEALQISERSVYHLLKTQQIPSISIGRSRRVFLDDLRSFARTGVAEIEKTK